MLDPNEGQLHPRKLIVLQTGKFWLVNQVITSNKVKGFLKHCQGSSQPPRKSTLASAKLDPVINILTRIVLILVLFVLNLSYFGFTVHLWYKQEEFTLVLCLYVRNMKR